MEGFVKYLKKVYRICPDTITRDNVNIGLIRSNEEIQPWSFLEEAVLCDKFDVIQVLLDMGSNISYYELYNANTPTILSILLDNVVNINNIHIDEHVPLINNMTSICGDWYFETLIDYGLKCDYMSINHPKKHFDYVSKSEARVIASRKALAALMILRKEATFRAVRDVFNAVAREMWAQKGPSGCGPRAYEWLSEKGRME